MRESNKIELELEKGRRINGILAFCAIVMLMVVGYLFTHIKTEFNSSFKVYTKDMVDVMVDCNFKYTRSILNYKYIDETNDLIKKETEKYLNRFVHRVSASEINRFSESDSIRKLDVFNLYLNTIDGVSNADVSYSMALSDKYMQRIMDEQIAIRDSIVAHRASVQLQMLEMKKQQEIEIRKNRAIVDAELRRVDAMSDAEKQIERVKNDIEKARIDRILDINRILTTVLKGEGYSSDKIDSILEKYEPTIKN